MRVKTVSAVLALFVLTGASVGFFAFHSFINFLLSKIEHQIITVRASEVFDIQLLFSVSFALAFGAAPLAALIAHKYFALGSYSAKLLIFTIVMIASMLAGLFYYQNHLAEMFAAVAFEPEVSMPVGNIPVYRIPLLSASITIFTAFAIIPLRAKRNDP